MDHFSLPSLPDFRPDYNIPPGQKILTVVQLEDGSKKAVNLHWGLIPSWSHDSKISSHLINARAESLLEKPPFRNAYQHRRCLIPATGFFEWQSTRIEPAPGRFSAYTPSLAIAEPAPCRFSAYTPSLAITGKHPYHVHYPDNRLFAFAGVWEHWKHDQATIYSCAIITTAANDIITPIHARMPA